MSLSTVFQGGQHISSYIIEKQCRDASWQITDKSNKSNLSCKVGCKVMLKEKPCQ